MNKILIIEDDSHINQMLCELLSRNNYTPFAAFSGTEALLLLQSGQFSLILLDLMLPGKTGAEVLEEIRRDSKHSAVPVIALTAVSDKESVVALLKAGADDYITKPFDNAELLARIEVRLRNQSNTPAQTFAQTLCFREVSLDLERFDAFAGENALGLSRREFEILRLLMENPQKVFTKNNLYESVWNDEFLGDDNTINVHISKLRSKIAKFAEGEYIKTVWGIGFKMNT
jgi:DNA-binding response OmpR family regulator